LGEQGHLHFNAHLGGTAGHGREDFALAITVRAHEAAHVFNYANHFEVRLFAKVNLFPDICQGNLLRGCHDDHAQKVCLCQVVDDRNVLV
jgi:hypothetical protein